MLGHVQVVLLVLFSFALKGNVDSLSYADQIRQARTSSDDRLEQISALSKLESGLIQSGHRDTLGLLYYALCFRYRAIDSLSGQYNYGIKAIEAFDESDYEGYQYANSILFTGQSLESLDLLDSALYYYQLISEIPLSGRGLSTYTIAIARSSQIYRQREDYTSALDLLEYSFRDETFAFISPVDRFTLLLEKSILHSYLLDSTNLIMSQQMLGAAKDIADSLATTDAIPIIESTMQEGNLALINRDYNLSLDAYYRALKLANQGIERGFDFDLSKILSSISFVYLKQEEVTKAIEYSKLALSDFSKYGDPEDIDIHSLILENLADGFIASGELDSAAHYVDLGLAEVFNKPSNSQIRLQTFLLFIKAKIAKARFEKTGESSYLSDGIKTIYELDQLFDIYIEEQLSEISVRRLKEDGSKYYKLGIDLSALANNLEAFWYFSEKAKGLSLIRAILDKQSADKASDFFGVNELIDEIALLEYDLSISDEAKKPALETELSRLRVDLQKKNLSSIDTASISLRIASIEDIKSQLEDTETYIQYKFGTERLYALVLQQKNIRLFDIASSDEIREDILSFRHLVGDSESPLAELKKQGYSIYQELLAIFDLSGKSITIIPDEEIFLLPFDALLLEPDQEDYVGLTYACTFLPSASFTKLDRNESRSTDDDFLIASPYYASGGTFPTLPFASEEVSYVYEAIGGDLLDKEINAYKTQLVESLKGAKIFHFSGHAIAKEGQSYLALNNNNDRDSRLLLQEIHSLPLKADLVVLSACNTGVGKIIKGEGIASLSRGFLYGGAKSIVQSLWTINDQSTGEIIRSYYEQLKVGASKDQALLTAKRAFYDGADSFQRHPYYWAGLTVIGDKEGLILQSFWAKNIKLVVIFLLITFAFLIRKLIVRGKNT